MSAKLVDGNTIAKKIIQEQVEVKDPDHTYRLGVVVVGNDPASLSFIKKKQSICEQVGIKFLVFEYPTEITTRKLRLEIGHLQKKRNLDGLIVQLPLPKHITVDRILDGIQIEKDVDCLSTRCVGKSFKGLKGLESPVTLAFKRILEEYDISLDQRRVLIVGAGRLIGKPLISYLINQKVSVMVADVNEKNLAELVKLSDIIISGVGQTGLIDGKDIQDGVILIDCGFSLDQEGKVVGDMNVSDYMDKASLVCPVPNGIGPIVSAYLARNVIEAVKNRK